MSGNSILLYIYRIRGVDYKGDNKSGEIRRFLGEMTFQFTFDWCNG